jgi:hypothetical protein
MRRAVVKGALCALVFSSLLFSYAPARARSVAATTIRSPQCPVQMNQPAVVAAASVMQNVQADGPFYVDPGTQASFVFTATRDGGVRMRVYAQDLTAEKVVYPDGRFRLLLETPEDSLAVAVERFSVEIDHEGRHLDVEFASADEQTWLRVKRLIAGSRALHLFRMLASSLSPASLQTPAGLGVRIGDAVLGQLDGDAGAIARLREEIVRRRQARIRTVALTVDDGKTCYETYEEEVIKDAAEYDECRTSFSWYSGWQAACVLRWTLQVESAWFQFLACSAISPFKVE